MKRTHWSYGALLASGVAASAIASQHDRPGSDLQMQASESRNVSPANDRQAPAVGHTNESAKGPVATTVSFAPTSGDDFGYFAIRGFERTMEIGVMASAPAASAFSVPIDSPLTASPASFAQGEDFATTTVSIAGGYEQGPGVYAIDLGTPSDASVGLTPPTSTTLELRTYPPTREDTLGIEGAKLAGGFCATECTYYQSCGNYSGRKELSDAKASISPPTDFGAFEEVDTLRGFRDNVLANSPTGIAYINLYERHGYELGLVLFAEPTFFGHFRNAKDAWMPAFDSLVNGDGSAVIDASMITQMDQVFDHYRTYGSDRLRAAINQNYDLLQPGDFEGQTIGELAAHWATLPASPEIWGDGFDGP